MKHVNGYGGTNHHHGERHPTSRNWDAFIALLLLFILFSLFAFDLVMSCHSFVTNIVSCQKIDPLGNCTRAIIHQL
ncbi:hypothetical protein L484_007115 [Morus notabilis]|uniref:Uncharacterized protein n=1 Tax=Morus notabilis TaxID=981085 RepID=W9RRQ1_9ROSA|nr:hypothetical protein L484_007115 [Morus notabilis]